MTDQTGEMQVTEAELVEERDEDVVIDLLTSTERKATETELIIQRMIKVLAAEYHFPLETMARDVAIEVELELVVAVHARPDRDVVGCDPFDEQRQLLPVPALQRQFLHLTAVDVAADL